MSRRDLTVEALQNVGVGALQHAGACTAEATLRRKSRGVFAQTFSSPTRFDSQHFHRRVANEIVKKSDGIGAAAHTSD